MLRAREPPEALEVGSAPLSSPPPQKLDCLSTVLIYGMYEHEEGFGIGVAGKLYPLGD
jgi:hypothetical protein